MDKHAVLDTIERFRLALAAHGVRCNRIILYGSHADGSAREGSDIDLVVISEDFRQASHWQRIESLSAAIYDVWRPIEAVGLTPEEWEKGEAAVVQYAAAGQVVYAA